MEDILDILSQFGGGRGDQGNEVVRFLLASFFWFILAHTAFRQWKREPEQRDRIIFFASSLGLISEMLMFGVHLEEWKWYRFHDLLHHYYPPTEHAFLMTVSILIGFAFLKYYIAGKTFPRIYLAAGITMAAALYVVTAPAWFSFLSSNPDARFGLFWGDMAFRVTGSVFSFVIVAVMVNLRARKEDVPLTVIVAFTFFFLDDFLMIFNLASGDVFKDIYNPIRHNLHIWAIPMLIAVYWREVSIRMRRYEDRLTRMNDCFLDFGPNVDENIRKVTFLCRGLLGAHCACYSRPGGESIFAGERIPEQYPEQCRIKEESCFWSDSDASENEKTVRVHDLQDTLHADTVPDVSAPRLRTCFSKSVRLGEKTVGTLSVTFGGEHQMTSSDAKVLSILAAAVGIEEERRMVERKLEDSGRRLRSLSAHLQSVREDERESISRKIHDELGQLLTALKMDLYWLRKHTTEEPAVLHKKIEAMTESVNIAIRSVQRITAELRPSILDDLGLLDAIDWQSREFESKTGIKSSVIVNTPPGDLTKAVTTAVFRIYQEALTNVFRHAGATEVSLQLSRRDGSIIAEIRDNGKGIDEASISSYKSFGIMGMRERAYSLGGEVYIEGEPGKGTVVRADIPLKQKGEDDATGNDH